MNELQNEALIDQAVVKMREVALEEQFDAWSHLDSKQKKKLEKHTAKLDEILTNFIKAYSKFDTKDGLDAAMCYREHRDQWKKYVNREKLLHQPSLDIFDANCEKLLFRYNQIVEQTQSAEPLIVEEKNVILKENTPD